MTEPINNCKIVTWNCQGVIRTNQIKSFIRQHQPHIFAVLEARKIDNPKAKQEPTGYTIIKTEGKNPIYAYLRNDISYQKTCNLLEETHDRASNILNIKICFQGHLLYISLVYIHPRSRYKPIEECLDKAKPISGNWIIIGDLNARNTKWCSSGNNYLGQRVEKYADSRSLVIVNNKWCPGEGTYFKKQHDKLYQSTLDLVICKKGQLNKISNMKIMRNTQLTSDHHPVYISWDGGQEKPKESVEEKKWRIHPNLPKESWELYQSLTEKYLENTDCDSHKPPDQAIESLWHKIITAMNIGAIQVFGTSKQSTMVTNWTTDRRTIIAENKYKKAKLTYLKQPTLRNKYEMEAKKENMKLTYNTIKNEYWTQFSEKIENGKSVNWKVLQKSRRKESSSSRNFTKNGKLPESLKESLDNACERISVIFKAVEPKITPPSWEKHTTKHIPVSEEEATEAVNSIWNDTAPGPDRVHARMVKNLGKNGMKALSTLFNKSLEWGYLPKEWKRAKMILIKKKNSSLNDPETYRPISITSVVCRMMEKLILKRIINNSNLNQTLNNFQFGFRKKRSTLDAISRITEAINTTRQHKAQLPVLFLDIKKAFDSVDHSILLQKIDGIRMDTRLKSWIRAFLQCRTFFISNNGTNSKEQLLERGVPQGCVLSPFLFNIYINDLMQPINGKGMDEKIEYQLYADDGVVWAKGTNLFAKMGRLAEAGEHITKWANKNKIQFSKDKTNLVIFSNNRKLPPTQPIRIHDWEVKQVDSYKYLGLTLQGNGRWNEHFEEVTNKVKKTMAWLNGHNRKSGPPSPAIMIKILKTMIQSQMTYAINFWTPSTQQYQKMDSLQANAYGKAMQLQKGFSHDKIREELQIKRMKEIRDIEWNRFYNRAVNIEEKDHPTRQKVKSVEESEQIWKGRLKRLPTVEWEIKQAEIRVNNSDEHKAKTYIPQYLYRKNPCAWMSARIKYQQDWGSPYHLNLMEQQECRYWKCMKDGVSETSQHVLEECPEFLQIRELTKEKLWWSARMDLNHDTIRGVYHNPTKKQLAAAEEIITKYIVEIASRRPFCYWRAKKSADD